MGTPLRSRAPWAIGSTSSLLTAAPRDCSAGPRGASSPSPPSRAKWAPRPWRNQGWLFLTKQPPRTHLPIIVLPALPSGWRRGQANWLQAPPQTSTMQGTSGPKPSPAALWEPEQRKAEREHHWDGTLEPRGNDADSGLAAIWVATDPPRQQPSEDFSTESFFKLGQLSFTATNTTAVCSYISFNFIFKQYL